LGGDDVIDGISRGLSGRGVWSVPMRRAWTATVDGLLVDVRLTARGGRDAIDGAAYLSDGRMVVAARVRAPPFEGQANAALCRLLADALHVAPRDVALVAGASARLKRIRIAGDATALAGALERMVDTGDSAH
jgi:uncharacterized protein